MSKHRAKEFLPDTDAAIDATELAKTLYKIPTLLTTWTRCGKPQCRCNAGHLHGPYHVLYWREGSRQHRRYVRLADVPSVRTILQRRRQEVNAQRLAVAQAMQTWPTWSQWIIEVEAQLRREQEPL